TGRLDLVASLMGETRALPGFVRQLVVGVARVAVDAVQRTAVLARVGAVVRADLRQRRLQVGDQDEERLAHVALVVVLVRVEPVAMVVAFQSAQEAEGGGGEIALGHGGSSRVGRALRRALGVSRWRAAPALRS